MRELAQAYTEEAIQTLVREMRTALDPRVRMGAANALLERGHGRPGQDLGGEVQLEVEGELSAFLDKLETTLSRDIFVKVLKVASEDHPSIEPIQGLSSPDA